MAEGLAALASPAEEWVHESSTLSLPPHIAARRDLVKRQPGFWRDLHPLPVGMEIARVAREVGFKLHVLTKGPVRTVAAWTEKVEWAQRHLSDADITITHDKGLVYGVALADDWPPYIERWIAHRPRGLVVMPAQPWNAHFAHANVFRYDGTEPGWLRTRLLEAYARAPSAKG